MNAKIGWGIHMSNELSVTNFINTELKMFSNSDNIRSIPSIIDGFKEAQRKAIYGLSKYGNSKEKVSRLAGKCAIDTNYAHGETSMCGTIVGLAQTYPGANNLNLLEPMGQFGTILSPDASSERYISTMKSKWFDLVLDSEDELIYKYKADDGVTIEPEHYYPVLPLWLVNGTNGIGTGYASGIIQRNVNDVARAIKNILTGKDIDELLPYFNGWRGTVVKTDTATKFEFHGKYELVNTTTIKVTELPIGYTVDKYKTILIDLLDRQVIKDYDNNSKESGFEFVITCPRELTKKTHAQLMVLLKLISRNSDVCTLWDTNNKIKRYDNIVDALHEFVAYRLSKFVEWKLARLLKYQYTIDVLEAKAEFIELWNSNAEIKNMKSSDAVASILSLSAKKLMKDLIKGFMDLNLRSVCIDKRDELLKEITNQVKLKNELDGTTAEQLYLTRLKPFL